MWRHIKDASIGMILKAIVIIASVLIFANSVVTTEPLVMLGP
jgi:hypothetical protein